MTFECWDNPLYTPEDRLEMAKGGIKFRDDIIQNLRSQIVAYERYLEGEQPCYSTGICGQTTCGYGVLDQNGYWEYPLYLPEPA